MLKNWLPTFLKFPVTSAPDKTLCVLPWIHLEMRSEGVYAPCCVSREAIASANSECGKRQDALIIKESPEQAFLSAHMHQLRTDLKSGKPNAGCQGCWDVESYGGISRRLTENARHSGIFEKIKSGEYSLETPRSIDVKFGNKCNLKCRICGPASSSEWGAEHVALYGYNDLKEENLAWMENSAHVWSDIKKWIPSLDEIEVYGGEPLLNASMYELLEECIASGNSNRQTLRLSSNGTVFSRRLSEDIFPKFSTVVLSLSLDGTFSQFEFQRHPAKWDAVYANFLKYRQRDTCELTISLSVSALNIYYLPEYLQFWQGQGVKIHLNEVSGPEYFDIRVLPAGIKAAVLEKFNKCNVDQFDGFTLTPLRSVLDKMLSADHSSLWPDFLSTVHRHDVYRGESYAQVFAEFAALIAAQGTLLKSRRTDTMSPSPPPALAENAPL